MGLPDFKGCDHVMVKMMCCHHSNLNIYANYHIILWKMVL